MPILGMHLFSRWAKKGHEMPMTQGALPILPYYQCILQNHNKQSKIREIKITGWGWELCFVKVGICLGTVSQIPPGFRVRSKYRVRVRRRGWRLPPVSHIWQYLPAAVTCTSSLYHLWCQKYVTLRISTRLESKALLHLAAISSALCCQTEDIWVGSLLVTTKIIQVHHLSHYLPSQTASMVPHIPYKLGEVCIWVSWKWPCACL